MKKLYQEPIQYQECPHCGGKHWGQRFDNCTYVNILNDPSATGEQRRNARDILDRHRAQLPVSPDVAASPSPLVDKKPASPTEAPT